MSIRTQSNHKAQYINIYSQNQHKQQSEENRVHTSNIFEPLSSSSKLKPKLTYKSWDYEGDETP